MVQVTGGRVVYSRTVQPASYESKKAEVELSFVLDDGEKLEKALKETAELVKREALELVGLKVR